MKNVQHGCFSYEKPLVWTLEIEGGTSSFEPMMSPNMSPRLSEFARGSPSAPNLTRCIPHSGHNGTIHEARLIGFNGLLLKDLTYGIWTHTTQPRSNKINQMSDMTFQGQELCHSWLMISLKQSSPKSNCWMKMAKSRC